MSREIDRDLRIVAGARKARRIRESDKHSVQNDARDNARGKLKIRSRTGGPYGRYLNHRKPKDFIRRGNRIENPMASLGYTDVEYQEYLRTGAPKNKEGN